MTETQEKKSPKALKFATIGDPNTHPGDLPLPAFLCSTTRSGTSEVDPLLARVKVEKVHRFAMTSRDAANRTETLVDPQQEELLALEADDGTTLFIRADALCAAVERLRPEAVVDGVVDLARFRDPNATARGITDVVWKLASVLKLPEDGLLEEAKQWAKEKLGGIVEDKACEVTSYFGAKGLMWLIESRLAGEQGLYCWHDKMLDPADLCKGPEDPPPKDRRLAEMAAGKPALVLIHGTGSYTVASFRDLREDEATWRELTKRFPGGIFGFEHRTFSESPAENALALLAALPEGAKVSLLTHSRGGLVGDLLCLDGLSDEAIERYRHDFLAGKDAEGRERAAEEELVRLGEIPKTVKDKGITIERYVRVACPARGTRLLSENLDAALSDLLNLLQWGGGAAVSAVASALGGPVAGKSFGDGASSCLGVLKRLALEIAGRRIDPCLVPGIAAMRVNSPLANLLSHPATERRAGIEMAVIAGDTEFDGLGLSNLSRRIANLFCDWRLFDHNDNDLVVDTDSMYAGLGFRQGARYLYDQDASVTHFRYFRNPPTRDALRGWLTAEKPEELPQLLPLGAGSKKSWREIEEEIEKRSTERGMPAGPRPVVILVPGIMGSHIGIGRDPGERVWFNLLRLAAGELPRIGDPDAPDVQAEDLFEMFYGDLAGYLADTHEVIRCPYDWRRPLDKCAEELKAKIDQAATEHAGQPIRLLAHSMGGLVTRMMIANYPDTWNKVDKLVMLGTPNNGAHLMAHTLLGKSDSVRHLAALDLAHNLWRIVDVVAGFPGALALLPRPGFVDAGPEPRIAAEEFYTVDTWTDLGRRNTDRWCGDGICGQPTAERLKGARDGWQSLPKSIPNPERVAYVFGQSDKTPCGVQRDGKRLKLLFTPDGDGSVTWESGKLEGLAVDSRCWYMPVEHADLTGESDYFPAILELLEKGTTDKLNRLPRQRGETMHSFVLEAGPPVVAGEAELARSFMGSGPRRRKPAGGRGRQSLRLSVRAGDVRYVDQPVLCGHYIGDAISGPEFALDEVLRHTLSERERIGVYAGEVGTSAIVLQPPNPEERARGSMPGAVIVGLGKYTGQLSAHAISETVRAAVLRFLLQVRDTVGAEAGQPVKLFSLLIGWGSSPGISLEESVGAVTLGVLEANHEFLEAGKSSAVTVTELCFVELYRDAAISAAQAVRDLPNRLVGELKRLNAHIAACDTLAEGEGVKERLAVGADLGHWSRLIVTDADVPDKAASADDVKAATPPPAATKKRYYPDNLKYVFLSPRARAETVCQQQQPGLIEKIIRDQQNVSTYNADLARTLFQLMVPLDFKAAAREQSRLLLVLDSHTANLPWELLRADDEPLVLNTRVIRQLETASYRPTIRTANTDAACIIVNPSTEGFDERFGAPKSLANLPGATREGNAVAGSLRAAGWSDVVVTAEGREALDILNTLYAKPYRVLMIGAHGIVDAADRDGQNRYTGVVLSGGMLITAAEIRQMEVVPEVVVLSCCHLGSVDTPYSEANRFASSVVHELIDIGVRCVIAAGWEVNDDAACTFSTTFFDQLTKGKTFGEAVFDARRATYLQHPGCNTWGAYQAYGDTDFRLHPDRGDGDRGAAKACVAVEELLAEIRGQLFKNKKPGTEEKKPEFNDQQQWLQRQLGMCPAEWARRPDVQQAIAEFYADLAPEGFELAREAYLRAVQLNDKAGRVAIRAIEQLANVEARLGYRRAEGGAIDEGLRLIDGAIGRLNSLGLSVAGDDAPDMSTERAALLGSALKLKAAALALQVSDWKERRNVLGTLTSVPQLLKQAADAYVRTLSEDRAKDPYNTLNWLPLEWLAGGFGKSAQKAIGLAEECGDSARKKFADKKEFWDAVMSADAEMTAWMMGKPIEKADVSLREVYASAVGRLPKSAREWDSVVTQWRLMAVFLRRRNKGEDGVRAQTLNALAEEFRPSQKGAGTISGTADTKARPRAAAKARAAPKKQPARPARAKPTRKTR